MTHEQIINYCLKKNGAYLDYPFDPTVPVARVKAASQDKGRIFAQIFFLCSESKVMLNCNPESAEFYRSVYPGSVVRGWHCPPVQQPHFNTINLDGSVPDDEIIRMIDHAYEVVVGKYPKCIQREIENLRYGGCRMEYIKVSQAAEKWGLSTRRVRLLCQQNRIDGVIRKGNLYMIPADALKPVDVRSLKGKQLPSEFSALFLNINAKKAELERRRPLTSGEAQRLHDEFMVEFTYNSNAIEGNTLTLKETAMVLEGITIDKKPLKDHLEAVGQRDAFLYVENIATKQTPINETVIKHIHSLVLVDRPEDKGVYRRIPVTVMGAYTEPVQPYLIEPKMTELLSENEKHKKTMHPIERIARFHLKFEGIHPFIDGNGRTGRLIMNLDLIRNGYPAIDVKFTDRKKYYDAFDVYYRDNDASAMIALVSGYLSERLDKCLEILG